MDCLLNGVPGLLGNLLLFGLNYVGKTEDCLEDCIIAELDAKAVYLLQVAVENILVYLFCLLCRILLKVCKQVYVAPLQFFGNELPHFHLLFARDDGGLYAYVGILAVE